MNLTFPYKHILVASLSDIAKEYAAAHLDDAQLSRTDVNFHLLSKVPLKKDNNGPAYSITLAEYNAYYKLVEVEIALERRRRLMKAWSESMKGKENEAKVDELMDLFFRVYKFVNEKKARPALKHFLRNVKRLSNGEPQVNQILFAMYSLEKGNAKSEVAHQLCRACSLGKLNRLNSWSKLNPGVPNESVFANTVGPICKDEIGPTAGLKDIIKEFITTETIEIHEKYKQSYTIDNLYPIVLTANRDPSPFVFEDEGSEERRNASFEVIGRQYDVEDYRTGYEYLFSWVLRFMSTDVVDEEDCSFVDSSSLIVDDRYITILQDMHTFLTENKYGFRKSDFYNALPVKIKTDKDLYYAARSLLDSSMFFKHGVTSNKSRRKVPNLDVINEFLDREETQLDITINKWDRPAEKINLHKLVDEIVNGNDEPTPEPDKKPVHVACCTEGGRFAKTATTRELGELLASLGDPSEYPSKENSTLIFGGYSSAPTYGRRESDLELMDCIMIDCDNNDSDPDIMDTFEQRFSQYEYYLYETASSTEECPRFRALFPMDSTVDLKKHDIKNIKKVVYELFSGFADKAASWFYLPTTGCPVRHHEGERYPSESIVRSADFMTKVDEMNRENRRKIAEESSVSRKHDVNWVLNNLNVAAWLNTPFPNKHGNGDLSHNGMYRAIVTAAAANCQEAYDIIREKALRDKWTPREIRSALENALDYLEKENCERPTITD